MYKIFKGFKREEKERVRVIVSDVDDTITTDGLLFPSALNALYKAKEKGLKTILVTGGSAGWADGYIRQWPIDAVIAESGALLIIKRNGRIEYIKNPIIESDYERKRNALISSTRDYVFSSDQYARLYDTAYEKAFLTKEQERRLYEIIESLGGIKLVSSIHVNVLFAELSKKKGIEAFFPILKEELGLSGDLESFYSYSLALGDSKNDEALFSAFNLSVGNKRVLDNIDSFRYLPTYITELYGSESFAFVIENLIS